MNRRRRKMKALNAQSGSRQARQRKAQAVERASLARPW
jgi:hypothetical protein